MRPNLFSYATGELSQDAFLCWLLCQADEKQKAQNEILHQVGIDFLASIYQKANAELPADFIDIEIRQQDGGIDILCIVNGDTAIIIEDKVGTKEHSDQLARYKDHVTKKWKLPSDKILSVYIQTGDQSDYREVEKNGYAVYERRDLLRVLEGPNGKAGSQASDILSNYSTYMRQIEDGVQSFRSLPPKDWSWNSWKGFYTELQKRLEDGIWKYVPNQSGGFLGYSWHFVGDAQCEQFLQLEQDKDKLCFKIWVSDPDSKKRRTLREFWHKEVVKQCPLHGLKAKRPDHFGNGDYMTVAILDREFRIADSHHRLDLDKTIELLRLAESVLDALKAQQALGTDLASSAA
jgi:hypothetical protein